MQRTTLFIAILAATLAGPALAQTDPPPSSIEDMVPPPPPPGGDALAPAIGSDMTMPPEAGQGETSMHGPGQMPERGNRGGGMYGSMMVHPPTSMPGVRIQMGQGRELDLTCGETGFADCLQAAMPIIERFMAQP